jgi:hypothetical protein
MPNLPVDRDSDYMRQMWGTTHLITDYTNLKSEKKVIQEIMHDDLPHKKHHLKEQTELHEKIRNDDDYDDWEYGTEPNYGKSGL